LKVYLGLGSNLRGRRKNIERAIALLMKNSSVRVKKISSLIETEPEGVKKQPFFLNGVVEIETDLPPALLLKLLKSIEKTLGRKATKRWGPRIIDLDILLYGELIIDNDNLKIPHSLLTERNFVLAPLKEIAPEAIHPILGKKIQEIYNSSMSQLMIPDS
jgi:2-amino-4-hydroxy-6-hydroxymethyldihydropteridine diphosphokinase